MGRSKPRTVRKAPPKTLAAVKAAAAAASATSATPNPNLNGATAGSLPLPLPLDLPLPLPLPPGSNTSSLIPPSTSVDLNDPNFRTAWQNWTTSALGRLDQLPKLSQSQLNAIAGAAAGIDGAGLGLGAQNLGIDLPASLAALFEAKLTLDREKAKLVKMQKELKGYKDAAGNIGVGAAVTPGMTAPSAAAAATGATAKGTNAATETTRGRAQASHGQQSQLDPHAQWHTHAHDYDHGHQHGHLHDHNHHHDHDHNHIHDHSHMHGHAHTKANEMLLEDDYGECTCHEHEEYCETDEDCGDCDCDCHVCDHDHDHDAEDEVHRSTLADHPERLDEAVRELFNWIKAVVWTLEQAAVVAGKRR